MSRTDCDRHADISLQTELNSLHGATMDSTQLLTEKLTLARELSAMKPEIDHLRSEAASYQLLLAEKLSLQRQLSTVQIELSMEKRATQRALTREGKVQAEDDKLESRLESLQMDLAKERRERQKIERKAQKDSTNSNDRITTLESRLDAFRNKLKSTKELLKGAQTSLQTAHASNQSNPCHVPGTVNSTSSMANPRKRAAAKMDANTLLGTPGDFSVAKNSKIGPSLIGEKSTFSITPFLNRTASVAPESSPTNNASGDDEAHAKVFDATSTDISRKAVASSMALSDMVDISHTLANVAQSNKPDMLQKAKPSKLNSVAHPARKTKVGPTLEQVAEENVEVADSATKMLDSTTKGKSSNHASHEGLGLKRRKRKLLGGFPGKAVFGEDEADALKDDQALLIGVSGFGAVGNRRVRVADIDSRRVTSPNVSIFGAISPLKKDRKLLRKG